MQNIKITRRFKIVLTIAVFAVCSLYIANKWVMFHQFDNSYPEITFEEELLNVSVNATEEELLQGVYASDKKDGDVTDSIIIESMSNLLEGNQRIITYVAFDNDNHVGKAQRKIQYTDYTPIRFSLDAPLEIADYGVELSEMLAPLKVIDCIDGDLSNEIVVVDSKTLDVTSEYTQIAYQVQVTNSCGEVESLEIPVKMSTDGTYTKGQSDVIELSEYLIYCKVGDYVDLGTYLTNINLESNELETYSLDIQSELDTSIPGVYTATYTVTWGEESFATSEMIIVVEE